MLNSWMSAEMILKLAQSFGAATGTIVSYFHSGCTALRPPAAENQRGQLIQFLLFRGDLEGYTVVRIWNSENSQNFIEFVWGS